MKKNLFMVAAVALMAMVSCNKEEVNNGVEPSVPTVPYEFTAYADGAETPVSKTTLNTEGESPKTHWLANDLISVNGYEFKVDTESEVGEGARFLGELPEDFEGTFKAVYPSTAGTFESLTIPETQDAYEGDFDAAAVVAVAQSETNTLAFKNVTSLLKFQVPADFADIVTSITITSTDALAGTIKINSVITVDEETTIDYSVTSAKKSVTVNCAEGFDPTKTYYVAVLPGNKNDFVVRVNGYLSKNVAAVNVKRSIIMNMKTLPAPEVGTYKLMGLDNDWSTGKAFYKDIDGYLLQDVSLTSSQEFKLCQGENNDVWGRTISLIKGKWLFTYPGDGNMSIAEGKYDIWASSANDAVCMVDADSPKPEFTSDNKQLHILVEGDANNGLYMWVPNVDGYNNWDAAWQNYNGTVKIDQSSNNYTDYYYYQLPAEANDKTCKFIVKWYGGQSEDYNMKISTDLPFWRNNGGNGSYSLTSKINIQ